jgi:hypothetical protein
MCIVFAIIVSCFLWLGVYFQAKIHDELKLVFEMASIGLLWFVLIGMYVITSMARVRPNVIPTVFIVLLSVLSFLVSFGMPIWLAWVSPRDASAAEEAGAEEEDVVEEVAIEDEPESSREARVILSKGEKLDDVIMLGTKWTTLFLEFMGFRMCEEGFYFYLEVTNYKKADPPMAPDALLAEFTRIRSKFIGSGAPFQVNIPDHMVKNIAQRVEGGTPPTLDIFDDAFVENRKVLVTDVFPAFKVWKKTKEFTAQQKAKMDPVNWPKTLTRKKSLRVNAHVNQPPA